MSPSGSERMELEALGFRDVLGVMMRLRVSEGKRSLEIRVMDDGWWCLELYDGRRLSSWMSSSDDFWEGGAEVAHSAMGTGILPPRMDRTCRSLLSIHELHSVF